MRKCLILGFIPIVLILSSPTFASDLLPHNLPGNWKNVDASRLEATNTNVKWRLEVRVNAENGDVLIASRRRSDNEDSSLSGMRDSARSLFMAWMSSRDDASISVLRDREASVSSVRTKHTRDAVERETVTQHPISLATLVHESDRGSLMANSLTFRRGGEIIQYQHISARPISDRLILRLALVEIRDADSHSVERPIEP